MISRTDIINQAKATSVSYATQEVSGRGSNNLFVGSEGSDTFSIDNDSSVVILGGGDDVLSMKGNGNTIDANAGNNTIVSIGNSNSITTGAGSDYVLSVGNGNSMNVGDGNNVTTFYGDNTNIKAGNGDQAIFTLDTAIANGLWTGYSNYVNKKTLSTYTEVKTQDDIKTQIAKQYNLSESEVAVLKSIDLTATLSDGTPKYAIAKSVKKSTADKPVYVIVARDNLATHSRAVSDNECIASDSSWTSANILSTKTATTYTKYEIDGVSNFNITAGNGNKTVFVTADKNDAGNISLLFGNGNNNINITSGYTATSAVSTATSDSQKIYTSGATHTSPLIIDYNQDGVVSAAAAKGIDLDGNGTADGAAVGGDKMLAMTDINGNGLIDGAEVFGNETVNPFTGEKINAANGFEALKVIAQTAVKETGIDCIDEKGLVDLKALANALSTIGVKLGFVSDNNNTTVEDLTKVAYIDTANYIDQKESGAVQHNQLGTSIFEDGSIAKVDDVWFELTGLNNPFS